MGGNYPYIVCTTTLDKERDVGLEVRLPSGDKTRQVRFELSLPLPPSPQVSVQVPNSGRLESWGVGRGTWVQSQKRPDPDLPCAALPRGIIIFSSFGRRSRPCIFSLVSTVLSCRIVIIIIIIFRVEGAEVERVYVL